MTDPPTVSAVIPAATIPPEILKNPLSGDRQINFSFDRQTMGKIEGDPQPERIPDAQREAYLAYQLAKRPDVHKVLLGDAAIDFLYGRAKRDHEQDVDVIALLNNSDVILGDAKGEYFAKAIIEQMPHTTTLLKAKGRRVVEGILMVTQPKTIICSTPLEKGGQKWIQVGVHHPSIDPKMLDGRKPACDPGYVYLLDPDLNRLHNPSGFAIKPHTPFPWLETHTYAPELDQSGHIKPGIWSFKHPFTIPTTNYAKVRIGFVR